MRRRIRCLLAELEMVLKAYHIVGIGTQVLLPELYHSVGHLSGARIAQADRLHRTEAQRIAAAAGNLFNRQAALEVVQVLPNLSPRPNASRSARREKRS